MAIFMACIVCGCLCSSSDSGGVILEKGLKGPKTTTTIADGADMAGLECLTNCDYGCKGLTDSCVKDCVASDEGVCSKSGRDLVTCQKACHSVTKTAEKAPNPRTVCLDKCAVAFEDGCDKDDLASCVKGCAPEYRRCMSECAFEC
ncbi:MAG: hypothetical protein V1875_07710 [Candidatus Altiarchaeota archaeon]